VKSKLVHSSPLLDSPEFPAQNLNHKIKSHSIQPTSVEARFGFDFCLLAGRLMHLVEAVEKVQKAL